MGALHGNNPQAACPLLNRRILAGHNLGVDWRLLHRRHPAITPIALIDTLRLGSPAVQGTLSDVAG